MEKVMITLASNNSDAKIQALKIALGIMILFAASQIAIPLEPVPITMQTVAVMLIGLLYSRRLGLITVLSYTVLGGAGLPMFQGYSGGLAILLGPTAGFIVGFSASVWVMATFRDKWQLHSFKGIFLNCAIGTLIIFIFGVTWLTTLIGFTNALTFGVVPFIIPGAIKAFLLSKAVSIVQPHKRYR